MAKSKGGSGRRVKRAWEGALKGWSRCGSRPAAPARGEFFPFFNFHESDGDLGREMKADNSKDSRSAAANGARPKKSCMSTGKRPTSRATAGSKPRGAARLGDPAEARPSDTGAPVAAESPKEAHIASALSDTVRSTARDADMLRFLQEIALGKLTATPLQVRAAIAAVQYTHAKMGEGGKKAAKVAAAKKAAGKFASLPPPKLVVNNGK